MQMKPPDNSALYKSPEGYRMAMEAYEKLLGKLTVPYETHWVETAHGLTHVLAAGRSDAPPIFFWHGMDASAPTWVEQINAAAPHYRVYAADTPGSMGKSVPERLDRNGAAYGAWMRDVMNGLGVERVHQVGISLGGWLILKLATVAPEKISSAFLMSSAGFVNPNWRLILKMLPVLLTTPRDKQGERFLRVMGAPGIQPAEQDVVMFDILMKYFHYEQAPGPLPNDDLRRLTAPTYLLMGEHEAAFRPQAVIQRAKAVLANLVKAEILPRVGHGMITEDVAAVNERIFGFIGEQS
ncbi:MAG: alpha/beta fold hydrolase [Anaerolineae bacterium]|nr:alpha/beta fold hydrolase [Anaerolineae bacterium]